MIAVHIKLMTILAGSPLLLLLIHMVLSRIMNKTTSQKVAVYSVFLGYLVLLPLVMPLVFGLEERPDSAATAVVYCILVYSGFAYTYFHFFNPESANLHQAHFR